MASVLQDARYAIRILAKSPGFIISFTPSSEKKLAETILAFRRLGPPIPVILKSSLRKAAMLAKV